MNKRIILLSLFGFLISCTAYREGQIRKKLEPIEFKHPWGYFYDG